MWLGLLVSRVSWSMYKKDYPNGNLTKLDVVNPAKLKRYMLRLEEKV